MPDYDPAELALTVAFLVNHLDELEPWRKDALCREFPDACWFPARGTCIDEARSICSRCAVTTECRMYAIGAGNERFGLWGGMSERQRRGLRRHGAEVPANAA